MPSQPLLQPMKPSDHRTYGAPALCSGLENHSLCPQGVCVCLRRRGQQIGSSGQAVRAALQTMDLGRQQRCRKGLEQQMGQEDKKEGTPGRLLLLSPVVVIAGKISVVGGGGRQRHRYPWQPGLGWHPTGSVCRCERSPAQARVPPEAPHSHLCSVFSKPWKAAELHAEVAQS